MTALTEVLKDALRAQNGFETSDGTFYMGSAGSVSVDKLVAAITAARLAVIELPTVACKGPDATDAGFFRQAARRIDTGTNVYIGGSNVRRAVTALLRSAADAAEAMRS